MEKSYCPFSKPFISELASYIANSDPQFKGMQKKLSDLLLTFTVNPSVPSKADISESSRIIGNDSGEVPEPRSKRQNTGSPTIKNTGDKKLCEYILTRGQNKGKPCDKNAKFEFEGKWYCGTSKEDENGDVLYQGHIRTAHISVKKEEGSARKAASLKSTIDDIPTPEIRAREMLLKMSDNRKTKVRRHPRFDVYYHQLSNLAVDPNKGIVLGNIEEDGTLGPLNAEQIRVCDVNNWINNFPESFGDFPSDTEQKPVELEDANLVKITEVAEIDIGQDSEKEGKEEEEEEIVFSDDDLDIDLPQSP